MSTIDSIDMHSYEVDGDYFGVLMEPKTKYDISISGNPSLQFDDPKELQNIKHFFSLLLKTNQIIHFDGSFFCQNKQGELSVVTIRLRVNHPHRDGLSPQDEKIHLFIREQCIPKNLRNQFVSKSIAYPLINNLRKYAKEELNIELFGEGTGINTSWTWNISDSNQTNTNSGPSLEAL